MDALANISHQNILLSRNRIDVNIPAYDPDMADRRGLSYLLELYAPDDYLSPVFEKIISLEASEVPPYEQSGISVFEGAYFPTAQYVDSFTSYTPPVFGQAKFGVCENLITTFFTKGIVKNNGDRVYEQQYPSAHVLKAGVDERIFSAWQTRLFSHPQGLAYKFLTNKPNPCLIQADQPEYLYFLTNFSPLPTTLHLRADVHYADGSTATKTALSVSGITAFTVYSVPVSVDILQLKQDPKEVDSYDVWLSDQNLARVSEMKKYVIDKRHYPQTRYILFSTGLGGFDTLALFGKGKESIKITREESTRFTPFGADPTYSETVVNQAFGERTLTVNTGHLSSDQLNYLDELAFAKECFLVSEGGHLPIRNTATVFDGHQDGVYLRGRELSFSYANKQYNYSGLSPAPPEAVRQTEWRPFGVPVCLLSPKGMRTGMGLFPKVQKFFSDTGTPVVPIQIKRNLVNTEGYVGPVPATTCAPSTTPHVNTRIYRQIGFNKNDCPVIQPNPLAINTPGVFGTIPFVEIPAGTYGSEINQPDAQLKAEGGWLLENTGDNARALGQCVLPTFLNTEIPYLFSLAKSDCPPGSVGGKPAFSVAAGEFGSIISQFDADNKAILFALQRNTQAFANAFGTCTVQAPCESQSGAPSGQFHFFTNDPAAIEIHDSDYRYGNHLGLAAGPFVYAPGTNHINLPKDDQPNWFVKIYNRSVVDVVANVKVYDTCSLYAEYNLPMTPGLRDNISILYENGYGGAYRPLTNQGKYYVEVTFS